MIEQQGQVLAVGAGSARVRLGGTSGCTACDAGRGCGAGIFGQLLRRKPFELDLPDPIDSRVGQAVVVGIPESLFLGMAFRFYGLPLLLLLAGGSVGAALARFTTLSVDVSILLGALAGGLIGWRLAKASKAPSGNGGIRMLRAVSSGTVAACSGQTIQDKAPSPEPAGETPSNQSKQT